MNGRFKLGDKLFLAFLAAVAAGALFWAGVWLSNLIWRLFL